VVRFMPGGFGGFLWQRVTAARQGRGHAAQR
jgi:hypothetical protein